MVAVVLQKEIADIEYGKAHETEETKNQVFGHILPLLVWSLGLFS
jgi:hypothetical protein